MSKILLVEDDQLLGKLYSDLLSAESDLSVSRSIDGEDGYNKIVNDNWDLILLDTLLPKMNAVDILNKIKQSNPQKLNQKIIIITNLDDSKMLTDLKKFGYEILIKNQLNPDQFVDKIKTFFNH